MIPRSNIGHSDNSGAELASRFGNFFWILGGGPSYPYVFQQQNNSKTIFWSMKKEWWFDGPKLPHNISFNDLNSKIVVINSEQAIIFANGETESFDSRNELHKWKKHLQELNTNILEWQSCTLHITKYYQRKILGLFRNTMHSNIDSVKLYRLMDYDFDSEKLEILTIDCSGIDDNSILKSIYGVPYLIHLMGEDLKYSLQFYKLDLSENPIICLKKYEHHMTFSTKPFKENTDWKSIFFYLKRFEITEFFIRNYQ